MNKEGSISYVLVSDIDSGGELWYYAGYYLKHVKGNQTFCVPVNSAKYTLALKMQFKDEAEALCKEINKTPHFTYHVEEHGYM